MSHISRNPARSLEITPHEYYLKRSWHTFSVCKKVKGTIFKIKFFLCVKNTDGRTVEGIINSGNNHGYKYIVKGAIAYERL